MAKAVKRLKPVTIGTAVLIMARGRCRVVITSPPKSTHFHNLKQMKLELCMYVCMYGPSIDPLCYFVMFKQGELEGGEAGKFGKDTFPLPPPLNRTLHVTGYNILYSSEFLLIHTHRSHTCMIDFSILLLPEPFEIFS